MKVSFKLTGVFSLVVLVCLFSIPSLLAVKLDPKTAEQEIRFYLERMATGHFTDDLKTEGKQVPSSEQAVRLKEKLSDIKQYRFLSTEVKHFLFAPPGTSRRIYIVKTLLKKPSGEEKIRYFSVTSRNKLMNYFWVNDASAILWYFSF